VPIESVGGRVLPSCHWRLTRMARRSLSGVPRLRPRAASLSATT